MPIERLGLPKYDDVKEKARKIFEYFGTFNPTDSFDETRAQYLGLLQDHNKDALKNAYLLATRFRELIGSMENMRYSYTQKKNTYEFGKSAKFVKKEDEFYEVSLPTLESLDSDKIHDVLLRNVHKIRSLEIKSIGEDARFDAFGRFLKLCRSMDQLKTLKINAP